MVILAELFHTHENEGQENDQIAEGFHTDEHPGHCSADSLGGNIVCGIADIGKHDIQDAGGHTGHTGHDRTVDGHGQAVRALAVDGFLMVQNVREQCHGKVHGRRGAQSLENKGDVNQHKVRGSNHAQQAAHCGENCAA